MTAHRQRIALSETCIVLSTVVGIGTWLQLNGGASIMCSVGQVFRGANVGHGLTVAVAGGLLVSISLPFVRTSPNGLAIALLLGVLTLGGAIAFVAADSATWQASEDCGSLFGTSQTRVTEHVYYLYVLWGLPFLVLARKAVVFMTFRKAVLSLGVIAAGSGLVALAGCGGGGVGASHQLSDYKWTDETPSWSPNGREIVFASNRANPTSHIDQLYVTNANGKGVKRLFRSPTDAREPSFSPDGRTVVYAGNVLDSCGCFTNAGEISIVRANGTVIPRPLSWGLSGDASLPAWSPDGHWIAFFNTVGSNGYGGRSDLYVVRPDGTGLRRLASNVDAWAFAWSPDGKRIAFSGADEKMYFLRVDSTKAVPVANSNLSYVTTDIGWSPDGSKLAFIRGARVWDGSGDIDQRYLWVLDLKSHRKRRLNAVVDSQSVDSFGVSFTWLPRPVPTLVTLGNDYASLSFSLVDADGRGRHLLPASGWLSAGSASPDGKKLLFVDGPSGSLRSAIFLASADGRRFVRLTQVKR